MLAKTGTCRLYRRMTSDVYNQWETALDQSGAVLSNIREQIERELDERAGQEVPLLARLQLDVLAGIADQLQDVSRALTLAFSEGGERSPDQPESIGQAWRDGRD